MNSYFYPLRVGINKVIITFLLVQSSNSYSQNYQLIPDSCTFCFHLATDGVGNYTLHNYELDPSSQMTIDSIDYMGPTLFQLGFRQVGNKLYARSTSFQSDELVMDFDAEIGDTVFNLFSEGVHYNSVVTNKDSVILNGTEYHHFMELSGFEYRIVGDSLWSQENWTIVWNERGVCGANYSGFTQGGGFFFNSPDTWFQGLSGVYYDPRYCSSDPRVGSSSDVSCLNCIPEWDDWGIDELDVQISIYPNPITASLNVHFSELKEAVNFKILNSIGKTIIEGELINQLNSIDLSTISSGVYFIKLKDVKLGVFRFVKE